MNQRELTFRAWDDGKKEWLLGYELKNLGGFSLFGECVLMGEWAGIINEFIFERNGHKQDDLKVMQFTGLKDKNGKEIYEGDILEMGTGQRFAVEWNTSEAAFLIAGLQRFIQQLPSGEWFDHSKFCEVIGNIYENPELIDRLDTKIKEL